MVKLTGTPFACIIFSLLMVLAATILGIVACIGPRWLSNENPDLYDGSTHWTGLWKTCLEHPGSEMQCTKDGFDLLPESFNSGMQAVRAFTIMGIIFGGFGMCTGVGFILAARTGSESAKRLSNGFSYNMSWMSTCYMIAFFVFLGITRKGYKWGPTTAQPEYRALCDQWCKYGPDYWTMLAAWVLNFAASYMICGAGCCLGIRASKNGESPTFEDV